MTAPETPMKLQVKDSGAWRNVVSFGPEQQEEVLKAAAYLLKVLDHKGTTMRVADGDKALAYCDAPDFRWRES